MLRIGLGQLHAFPSGGVSCRSPRSSRTPASRPSPTLLRLQNGKSPGSHNSPSATFSPHSKWRRRVGRVTWWASARLSFSRRPRPRRVTGSPPPPPAEPRRETRADWLAAWEFERSSDAASSLPVVGSHFLSALGNNGEDNGCLSYVSEPALGERRVSTSERAEAGFSAVAEEALGGVWGSH